MSKKIAIQGIKGSFHHIASQSLVKDSQPVECMSFDETIHKLLKEECSAVVMALENSIAGSILPNYALIDSYNLNVVAEHYLDIQHNLLALPGQCMSEISEVHSHPMALLQCKKFFDAHPHIKLVEDKDTAETAKRIKEHQLTHIAAIASDLAAELYQLDTLAAGIQTIKHNETRFVLLTNKGDTAVNNGTDKCSLRFETAHHQGSLSSVLQVLSENNLNLSKIQSLPIIETPWRYSFFIDATFQEMSDFNNSMEALKGLTQNLKVLGTYKNKKQ